MSESSESDRDGLKHRLLAQRAPSSVKSIANAVVIKGADLFFLCDRDGMVPLEDDHGYGLYYHDCRFLSGYEIRFGGKPPDLLAASAARGFGAVLHLTNMHLAEHQLPEGTLLARWDRVVDEEARTLREAICIRNHGMDDVRIPLHLDFAASFEDVFQVRGLIDPERGRMHEPMSVDGGIRFTYDGLDGLRRTTSIRTTPEPEAIDGGSMRFRLDVASGGETWIHVEIEVEESRATDAGAGRNESGPERSGRAARRDLGEVLDRASEEWLSSHTRLETDSLLVDRMYGRSMRDLGMLVTSLAEHEFYAAGVPWFVTLFGRDSLLTCLMTLPFIPDVVPDTLRLLAAHQGRERDDWSDQQPGKILHELRVGELAAAGVVPYTPYYGSVDATPLFLILLARHAVQTGSTELLEELDGAVRLALEWLTRVGLDDDGLIGYDSVTEGGLINQGWKDSGDAIVGGDGRLADPPIRLIEVQAYASMAATEMASLLRRCSRTADAEELDRYATAMRRRIQERFWSESERTYAMALDGSGDPLLVSSSNAGHALWAGAAAEAHGATIAARLMEPDMFSGWGIRTVSAAAQGYNPVAYHRGTVWPHDNALIAAGLRRYAHDDGALRIFEGMVSAGSHFDHDRLPEVFAGLPREEYGVPVHYPVACHPQAWAAATIPSLIATLLGLRPDGFERRLRLIRPILPEYVGRLRLLDLRVAGGSCDLEVERTEDGDTRVHVLRAEGVEVVTESSSVGACLS